MDLSEDQVDEIIKVVKRYPWLKKQLTYD